VARFFERLRSQRLRFWLGSSSIVAPLRDRCVQSARTLLGTGVCDRRLLSDARTAGGAV